MGQQSCAVVVDSEAGLGEDAARGLTVVPLQIALNGELSNGLDAEGTKRIYQRLRQGEAATSSTPSPGDFLAAFERLEGNFASVFCLTIPGKWSGMLEAAQIAAQLFAEKHASPQVVVFETPTAGAGLGLVAERVHQRCREGAGIEEVMNLLQQSCRGVRMFGALDTLEFVAKSGRVPGMIAGISDALHVRPLFELHNGQTGRLGLARTEQGVIRNLTRAAEERFGEQPLWLSLFHADAEERLQGLTESLQQHCHVERLETVALSPVIGLHIGPGAIGFAALPVGREQA